MIEAIDLAIDVTDAVKLGETAAVAATVHLPPAERLADPPIVCFAKPGGGYSRRYYTHDLPGPAGARGAQAEWHAQRGWIFVSVDHLGVGDSSLHAGDKLSFAVVAAASHAAEAEILRRLATGTLKPGYPKLQAPVTIGIGQSMGGCMTVVQQGRYHGYDGIALLGYSVIRIDPPTRPGHPALFQSWYARDRLHGQQPMVLNAAAIAGKILPGNVGEALGWGLHFDDIPADVLAMDLQRFDRDLKHIEPNVRREGGEGAKPAAAPAGNAAPWASSTVPVDALRTCTTPGSTASEAAAITSPILIAMGERDVVADPKGEIRAYISATSVDFFVCPRMAHMHNFAGTRELLWRRIENWALWVCAQRHIETG